MYDPMNKTKPDTGYRISNSQPYGDETDDLPNKHGHHSAVANDVEQLQPRVVSYRWVQKGGGWKTFKYAGFARKGTDIINNNNHIVQIFRYKE